MSEGAGVPQTARLILFKVATQGGLILDIGHLIFVITLLEVALFTALSVILVI